MVLRAFWLRAIVCTFLVGGVVPPVLAQPKEKKPTRMVVRYVGHTDDGKHRHLGKPVMLVGVEPLEGGRTIELVVPNRDMNKDEFDPLPRVAEAIRECKRGDTLKIELDDSKPKPYVRDAERYKLKPGENDPKGYVFENSYPMKEGRTSYTAVVLSRFDEPRTVAVQQRRDKEGDMVSDAEILAVLERLKTGDVVEAEIREGGKTAVLTGLERYAPPQTGKFVKLAEQEIEGQKAAAVELSSDGKTVTAVVPGKLQGKRWVSDPKLLAAAKKLKPDAEVVYRAREGDGKVWLKEIEPAPKQKSEEASAARGGRESRDGNDERRGGRKADK
jgi:hypothetical protein